MLSHCIPLQPTLPHTSVVARILTFLSYVLICYYISYILIYIFFIGGHPTRGTFSHINEALQLMKKYLLAEIKAVMFMEKILHAKTSSFMIFI